MPIPNKAIFYKPESLLIQGIPKQLHGSIKLLAEQEKHMQSFDQQLIQLEQDIRACLNLGCQIYNLNELIQEVQNYLVSLNQNTAYSDLIQKYLQAYITDFGRPSIGQNPTALLSEFCQSNRSPDSHILTGSQISLLGAMASLQTLHNLSQLPLNQESINDSLSFLVQRYYQLLEQQSVLENIKSNFNTQLQSVFSNQQSLQTTPSSSLPSVEIQSLAKAIQND